MTERPYQRSPGDFEIRVLKDSRIVLVGPDQALMDLGKAMTRTPGAETDNERDPDDPAAQDDTETT